MSEGAYDSWLALRESRPKDEKDANFIIDQLRLESEMIELRLFENQGTEKACKEVLMHLLAVCRARCERVASQQYLLEHSSLNMINILIFKACTFSLHLRRKNQHSVVADIIKNFINKAETNGYFKKLPAI